MSFCQWSLAKNLEISRGVLIFGHFKLPYYGPWQDVDAWTTANARVALSAISQLVIYAA